MDGDELIHGLKITEIPGPLHSENWNHIGEGKPDSTTLTAIRDAHAQLLPALGDIVLTHCSCMANPMQTETTNLSQSYTYATRKADKALENAERAVARIREVVLEIDRATTRVPDAGPPETLRIYSDRLFNMSAENRRQRILAAIEEDDRGTLAAVFSISGWANGLTGPELDHYRNVYRQNRFPEVLKQRADLVAAEDLMTRSIPAFRSKVDSMFDKKKLADAAAASEAAKRRLAGGGF
jgi:hypothetical protein